MWYYQETVVNVRESTANRTALWSPYAQLHFSLLCILQHTKLDKFGPLFSGLLFSPQRALCSQQAVNAAMSPTQSLAVLYNTERPPITDYNTIALQIPFSMTSS